MTISVLVVDDHEVVRAGLRSLLNRRNDLQVVGVAANAAEAVERALATEPDVVIMDVRMPGSNGVEACREIRSRVPKASVLMLTSYTDEDAVVASILAGASGYLLKDSTGRELVQAIRVVASGGSLLDPAVTRAVLERIKAEESPEQILSGREQTILALISEGKTNREIGNALGLAEGTVRNAVSRILSKIDARSRTEAAARFAGMQVSSRHLPGGRTGLRSDDPH